jgi:hypothetical protein
MKNANSTQNGTGCGGLASANDPRSSVTPIRPRMRLREPDPASQAEVGGNRRMLACALKRQLEVEMVDPASEIARAMKAAVMVAQGGLPSFNLRLIVNDKREHSVRWREAYVEYHLALSARELASWKRIADLDNGGDGGGALGEAWKAAPAVADAALDKLMSVPAPGRDEIVQKRKLAGKYWLKERPDWQAYVDEDEARMPAKKVGPARRAPAIATGGSA